MDGKKTHTHTHTVHTWPLWLLKRFTCLQKKNIGLWYILYNRGQYSTVVIIYDNTLHPLFTPDPCDYSRGFIHTFIVLSLQLKKLQFVKMYCTYSIRKAYSRADTLFKRKIWTHLNFLSIPQSGGKKIKTCCFSHSAYSGGHGQNGLAHPLLNRTQFSLKPNLTHTRSKNTVTLYWYYWIGNPAVACEISIVPAVTAHSVIGCSTMPCAADSLCALEPDHTPGPPHFTNHKFRVCGSWSFLDGLCGVKDPLSDSEMHRVCHPCVTSTTRKESGADTIPRCMRGINISVLCRATLDYMFRL